MDKASADNHLPVRSVWAVAALAVAKNAEAKMTANALVKCIVESELLEISMSWEKLGCLCCPFPVLKALLLYSS